MLERLLELRWPISAVLSDEARSECYLDLKTDQWEIAVQLIKVLKSFDIATTFFSCEENPGILHSLSPAVDDLPLICKFKEVVDQRSREDGIFTTSQEIIFCC